MEQKSDELPTIPSFEENIPDIPQIEATNTRELGIDDNDLQPWLIEKEYRPFTNEQTGSFPKRGSFKGGPYRNLRSYRSTVFELKNALYKFDEFMNEELCCLY